MLRDVFYYGDKPNVHPREQFAENLADARAKATTRDFWIINEFCNYHNFDWNFDFEFLPDEDVWAEEHNNVWPSQHQKDSGTWLCPKEHSDVIIYRNDVDPVIRKNVRQSENWVELDLIDHTKFDFSWHPDPNEPPYIYKWGCKFFPAELKHVLEYHVSGATQTKYMNSIVQLLPQNDLWIEHQEIDKHRFDMSWRPNPLDLPYIYIWGNKYINGKLKPTLEYRTPGATDNKYMPETLEVLPEKDRWEILYPVMKNSFDFSWRPDPREPDYNYVFGNNHYPAEVMPTIVYKMPSATQDKYVKGAIAKLDIDMSNWVIPKNIDTSSFDFSWVPHPSAPPYIYEFATVWNDRGGPKYIVPGATEYYYVEDIKAKTLPDNTNWKISDNIDVTSFDFSWVPHPSAPPYIYEFATVWNDRGGPEYTVLGATEYKYIDNIKAKTIPNRKNWEIPIGIDVTSFDFSWVPHSKSPPYIYQFGTIVDPTDGPRYITPNNNGDVVNLERIEVAEVKKEEYAQYLIETSLEDLVEKHKNEVFWALNPDLDYSEFDFNWRPNIEQAHYVHAFGTRDTMNTQTYFVNGPQWFKGNREINYIEDQKVDIKVNIDMFYVDRGNKEATARFEMLKAKFGNKIQKTRYLNSWVDTINRCTNRATSNLLWVLNSELDYTDFDFDYYPNPWQMKMVNVFGTQWSHWGTTFLVNKQTFEENTVHIKIIEHLPNLNFVKTHKAKATSCVHDVAFINHENVEAADMKEALTAATGKDIVSVTYKKSYLDSIRELLHLLPQKKEHYVWVCSSVCDYSKFDFSYICDPFGRDNLHVFPSNGQKFGDTFFLDVNYARSLLLALNNLERHPKLNFNPSIKALRLKEPVIVHDNDTHINSLTETFGFPYATVVTSDNKDIPDDNIADAMNLWSAETKNIIITSTGATRIVVPKEAGSHVQKELYDYPYIKRAPKLVKSNPIDIVFLSNGETGADENYEHLLKVTENLPNRVVRVDGVNGRAKAYHAAAAACNTPWFFTVFAKLKVSPKFDFNWQPDRMQVPKHYIFHAKNPVNGLIYGHQAMIAYNKKLTLANDGKGLDFTLDDEHEVVPLISGTAQYNTDKFSTWRTAFREVIKLRADDSEESRVRLDAWLNKAEGDFAQYSIKGALDADEYYDEVDENFDKLKLSYEWAWLRDRFDKI
jgi:hypothetical protein